MRGRYTRAGSASLHLFKGRWGWLDVSIEGRAWLNVAYLQLEVRDRRARAGSVAPLHPLKRQRDSFAARLGVFLKVERSVPMERLGRAGCRLFAESEVCSHRARAGSVVPLHPLKRQRDSFAARLDVSIEGRACWFAFDELDVACLQNRRCATAARGRGVSLPCIPTRDGEVLLLRGWAFLLRVAHSVPMERLGRAGRCLFAESEVRDRCSRAGSVAPLHPLNGWRGSFVVLLGVSIEGKAC